MDKQGRGWFRRLFYGWKPQSRAQTSIQSTGLPSSCESPGNLPPSATTGPTERTETGGRDVSKQAERQQPRRHNSLPSRRRSLPSTRSSAKSHDTASLDQRPLGHDETLGPLLQDLRLLLQTEEYKVVEDVVRDYQRAKLLTHNVSNLLRLLKDHSKQVQSAAPDLREAQRGSSPSSRGGKTKLPGRPGVSTFCSVYGETYGAHYTLLDQVKSRRGLQVEERPHWQDSQVVVLFCAIASRGGSDVRAAMGTIRGRKPVILVLMHHTRDADFSTAGARWSDSFENVVLEVHVLYHQTHQGLLRCEKNQQAVSQIQEFLLRCSRT